MKRPRRSPAPARSRSKRILYYAPGDQWESFIASLSEVPECRLARMNGTHRLAYGGMDLEIVARHDPRRALDALHHGYFNLVILDLRSGSGGVQRQRDELARATAFLDEMDNVSDVELRYSFHRIVALVSGKDSLETDELIRALGARGVGRVMRDISTCALNADCALLPERWVFARQVLDEALGILMLISHRRSLALCAAGGGITGIYFELGALKCLDDCLPQGALNRFDMYFGISAGAVVSSMLVNGYSVEEFMAGIAGIPGGRISPFSLSLLRMAHLNLSGLAHPVRHLFRGLRSALLGALKGKIAFSPESLFLQYSDLLTAPFDASGFEELLRRLFSEPGRTNDFRRLRRSLYIGTTDQDARQHVLFGDPPNDGVPLSQAIQASISINPAFCATKIGRRFYVDGAVTRTSNFTEAIRKGAKLIFALDPLVPYVSKRPGFARAKGILYNTDQDIRTVSFTRFETTRYWVLRRHPEVSFYTFLPGNRLRRLMSVSPMDHRPYLAIWRGAYLSTLQRIRVLAHRMRGDLQSFGLALDTSRAEAVAERLEAAEHLSFADFFADGRVEIRRGVLAEPKRAAEKSAAPAFEADPESDETAA